MTRQTPEACADTDRFWAPEFEITHRADGTIVMRQTADLPEHLPTLAAYLDKWADETPDQVWLAQRAVHGGWDRLTYAAARDQARAIGGALLAMGLGPDRPLLILSENSIAHGVLSLACLYVGIPYAPVSPAYSRLSQDHAKLRGIADLLQPGAVFAEDGADFAPALRAIAQDGRAVINARNLIDGAVDFAALQDGPVATALEARRQITGQTVAKYLFTSGSTGAPKAVINTNAMICAMQAMVRDCYRFLNATPPVVLDWAPWNHTAAGNKVSYLVLTNGGTYYIDAGRPVAGQFDETLRNLREIACTWYFNVPVGWDLLVDALERDAILAQTFFRRLEMMFYAGAGMAQHTWDRLRAVAQATTGRDVLLSTSLGATESAPFALACTEVQDRSGNVGVPAAGLVMKLVPSGDKLELRLKGPSITPGYFGDPETTAASFDPEGFYRMGDALRPVDPRDLTRGFLFDGRIAETFKLSTGTWVSVGALRAGLVDAMGGLIRDAVIVGENEATLGALLLLSDRAQAMPKAELQLALTTALQAAAAQATGSASRIERALVLDVAPSFDRGEITEKGSLNQRAMRAHFTAQTAALFAGRDGVLFASA